MLPALPRTDILSVSPDAEAIDIWAVDFNKSKVPFGIGVYCFYDPTTNQARYIGSGCGQDFAIGTPSGLWLRIKTYRWPKKIRPEKTGLIGQLVREQGLLLKVWLTHSEGDARKYESDAVKKHKPDLNKHNAGHQTPETVRERIRAQIRASGERRKQRIIYEPDAERICLGPCGLVKKCREFSKHPRMKYGVYSVCKPCKAAQARVERQPPDYPAAPPGKVCTKCGSAGPFQRDKSRKDGLSYRCIGCLSHVVQSTPTS